jgi:hypothetical protein
MQVFKLFCGRRLAILRVELVYQFGALPYHHQGKFR